MSAITDHLKLLATREVELARTEIQSDIRSELAMARSLAIAAVCGLLGLNMLLVAGVFALATVMPMDEESARLKHRLRAEIDATREELGMYISKLDRRRHAALDVKQIRTHPRVVIGVGVAIVAAAAGGVAMLVRARKQKRPGRSVRRALSRFAPPQSPEPDRMISLILRSALPFGLAAARRFLRRTQTRRFA